MQEDSTVPNVSVYADSLGFELSAEELEAYRNGIEELEDLLEPLTEMPKQDGLSRDYWNPDEDTDPLGAFLTRCNISGSSSGLLSEMTVAVKDNIAIGGVPMTCGSPLLEEYIPPEDATVVSRLLDAGGTLVGKTNMDEFAYGGERSTMRYRLARNPHDKTRMPGITSSGSAVAVCEETIDSALGTDTGGSVRLPAAWCGIVGVKPTRGLVSHHGYVQFGKTVDYIGPMARTVQDAAKVLEVIAGEDSHDERTKDTSVGDYSTITQSGQNSSVSELTLGIPEGLFTGPAADVVRNSLEVLEMDGATLRTIDLELGRAIPAWFVIAATELGAYFRANAINYWLLSTPNEALSRTLRDQFDSHANQLGDPVVQSLLFAEHLNEAYGDLYYAKAQRARKEITDHIDSRLSEVDAIATPTVPIPAPKWETGIEDLIELVETMAPFNLTGHPAITIPCGTVDDLPVGLQLVSTHFEEETLFRIAGRWEMIAER